MYRRYVKNVKEGVSISSENWATCWSFPSCGRMVFYHGRYNQTFMEHTHLCATVVLVTAGAVCITIQGKDRILRPGQMAIIGPLQVHAARTIDDIGWKMRSLQILLPPTFTYKPPYRPIGVLEPVRDTRDDLANWFRELHMKSEQLYVSGQIDSDLDGAYQELVEKISGSFELVPKLDYWSDKAIMARSLLKDQKYENVSMKEIARAVCISESELIRTFRRNFGISPNRWRMQLRANEVARVLRKSGSLADVSIDCGFSDQAHMSRTFKRVFGVTPGQFARNC